jgi:lipopolysaccharide transport system ATP-binding protein
MSDPDVLITAEGASKKFCKDLRTSLAYGVQDLLVEALGRQRGEQLRAKEFWAVQGVSFEVRRGECLGLVGRNGAGKTTLLRMLNGLIKPDRGHITMRGRVGALIALGAGFNPILTGRENIYVNGAVLGLSKADIDARFDEIVDFAELGEFIDSPVQSYSSGMSVRLGYAIASSLEPDILILDEVLAVGDEAFRLKCYQRIGKMMDQTAVILVSHNMEHIGGICSSVLFLRNGRQTYYPNTIEGIDAYFAANEISGSGGNSDGSVRIIYPPVRKVNVQFANDSIRYGESMKVDILIDCESEIRNVEISFTLVDQQHRAVMCYNSVRDGHHFNIEHGEQIIRFQIKDIMLHDGKYTWNLNLKRRDSIENIVYFVRAGEVKVWSPFRPLTSIPYLPSASTFEVVPRLSITVPNE